MKTFGNMDVLAESTQESIGRHACIRSLHRSATA